MQYSFLCLSTDFKGVSFIKTLKSLGHKVFLLTHEKERNSAWPRESIDEIFFGNRNRKSPHDRQQLVQGTAWLIREHGIDRIVALDDFDVEDAALLREEFRLPGMGQTTSRYFRDKLAMRMRAAEKGVPVPAFSALFRLSQLQKFCEQNSGPWVIKPRSEASADGILKVETIEEAVAAFEKLGEESYRYLIEVFAPGKVYHVDALVSDGELSFVRSSAYGDPPLAVVSRGGLFQTRTLEEKSKDSRTLAKLTKDVMKAFGMRYSASHTEFIQDAKGNYLFLETSSRVGGAYISNMIECATGIDLWSEWAKLELCQLSGESYVVPKASQGNGAVTIRTVSEHQPDLSEFLVPEVQIVVDKPYHAGFVLAATSVKDLAKIQDDLAERLAARFG